MFFSVNEIVFTVFFNDRTYNDFATVLIRNTFYFIPTFSFSILFGGLSRMCGGHLSFSDFTWLPGKECTWEDFFATLSYKEITDDIYVIPSNAHMTLLIFLIGSFYYVLAWYFDHIVASNRGVSSPYLFFFYRSYWRSLLGKEQI